VVDTVGCNYFGQCHPNSEVSYRLPPGAPKRSSRNYSRQYEEGEPLPPGPFPLDEFRVLLCLCPVDAGDDAEEEPQVRTEHERTRSVDEPAVARLRAARPDGEQQQRDDTGERPSGDGAVRYPGDLLDVEDDRDRRQREPDVDEYDEAGLDAVVGDDAFETHLPRAEQR